MDSYPKTLWGKMYLGHALCQGRASEYKLPFVLSFAKDQPYMVAHNVNAEAWLKKVNKLPTQDADPRSDLRCFIACSVPSHIAISSPLEVLI